MLPLKARCLTTRWLWWATRTTEARTEWFHFRKAWPSLPSSDVWPFTKSPCESAAILCTPSSKTCTRVIRDRRNSAPSTREGPSASVSFLSRCLAPAGRTKREKRRRRAIRKSKGGSDEQGKGTELEQGRLDKKRKRGTVRVQGGGDEAPCSLSASAVTSSSQTISHQLCSPTANAMTSTLQSII